jgi:hypothetical protein
VDLRTGRARSQGRSASCRRSSPQATWQVSGRSQMARAEFTRPRRTHLLQAQSISRTESPVRNRAS